MQTKPHFKVVITYDVPIDLYTQTQMKNRQIEIEDKIDEFEQNKPLETFQELTQLLSESFSLDAFQSKTAEFTHNSTLGTLAPQICRNFQFFAQLTFGQMLLRHLSRSVSDHIYVNYCIILIEIKGKALTLFNIMSFQDNKDLHFRFIKNSYV